MYNWPWTIKEEVRRELLREKAERLQFWDRGKSEKEAQNNSALILFSRRWGREKLGQASKIVVHPYYEKDH